MHTFILEQNRIIGELDDLIALYKSAAISEIHTYGPIGRRSADKSVWISELEQHRSLHVASIESWEEA